MTALTFDQRRRRRVWIGVGATFAILVTLGVLVGTRASSPKDAAPPPIRVPAPSADAGSRPSVARTAWQQVPPDTVAVSDSPVQREYDSQLASGLGSSAGLEAAEVAVTPTPNYSAAWPALPTSDQPDVWAETFVTRMLDIDFTRQSRAQLGGWLSAEAAPELLPGIPQAVQDKVLYLSAFDPTAVGGSQTPIPSAAAWTADARAGLSWKVSDLLVQPDPQWAQIIAAGWQPTDQRFAAEDISGTLTTSRPGHASSEQRFTLQVYVGSATWHPGYGSVLIAGWKVA